MTLVLFETTANTDAVGGTQAIRWGNVGYSHPSAPGYFEERLKDTASIKIRRGIYRERAGFGLGEEDIGIISAAARDGDLDALADYGYGEEATIKIGDSEATAYSSLTTVVKGRAARCLAGGGIFQIGWKGRSSLLDQPMSGGTFAGTNSGSTGLEGTADDIKGQRKPRCGGGRQIIEPVLVNGPARIFAWNYDYDGDRAATQTIHAVYLSGATWSFGTDHANAAALQAATPSAGVYDTCKAESLVKMGGSDPLSGGVRVEVTVAATAADSYCSNLAKALLLDSGVDSGDIDSTAFTALATARPYAGRYYVRDETWRETINMLLKSVLGWATLTSAGVYTCGTIPDLGGGAPVATFRRFQLGTAAGANDYDITSLEPVIEEVGQDNGAPAKEVTVRWGFIHAPYDFNGIAAAVADADKQKLSQQWRSTAPVTDSDTAAQFGEAIVLTYDTWLCSAADAATICSALVDFLGPLRQRWLLGTKLTPALVAAVENGALVEVFHPRFGFSAGKNGWVVNVESDAALRTALFEIVT